MTTDAPTVFARAFRRALMERPNDEIFLVRNLVSAIRKHGLVQHTERIVKKVSREIVRHHKGRWVCVETARPLPMELQEAIRRSFEKKDYIEELMRPELVAGMRIVVDGEREFDESLKRKLDKLFL